MAKAKTPKTPTGGLSASFDKVNDLLLSLNPYGEMMDVNPIAHIDEWIPTGNYILNAVLSGSLFGGLPNRRSLVLAGAEGTAKTFIAMSIVRSAIERGYHPIYFDSEGAIDREFVRRLGVDPAKVNLQPVNTVEQFSHIAAQIVKMVEDAKAKKEDVPKLLVVLDSLGNLTSEKEKTDTTEGENKRDMTKQQAIRKLFRVNGLQFAVHAIPFVVINHVYDSMSMFSPQEISGGGGVKYNASVILTLSKGVLKDDEGKKAAEKKNVDPSRLGVTIFVNPFKQRFARPIKIQIHIPYYKKPNPYVGLEKFANWESSGIMRGSVITAKEYSKLTPADQKSCHPFEEKDGEVLSWARPKETARTLVVKHLGGMVPISDLFTDKVFTKEVLEELDEKVIKPTFQLPDLYSLEEEMEDLKVILEEELKPEDGEN